MQESLLGGRGRRKKVKDNALTKTPTQRALYHCNYCQKDISHVPRIKCAECKDFDLCLECFSVGVEIKPHKSTHDYQVVENLSFPIFHPDWGTDEELLLLEAIDMCGLGNWAAVSEHVGGKTPQQCKEHYFQIYIDVDSFPLPTPAPDMEKVNIQECIARARQGHARKGMKQEEASSSAMEVDLQAKLDSEDNGARNGAEASPEVASVPALDGAAHCPGSTKGLKRHLHDLEEQAAAAQHHTSPQQVVQASGRTIHRDAPPAPAPAPNNNSKAAVSQEGAGPSSGPAVAGKGPPLPKPVSASDATGFHAKRFEFDPEYDHDAETMLADMEFPEDDGEVDVQHKLAMLHIYNRRLDERERRRAFVIDHGLLNTKAAVVLERRRISQEKELHARLRVFARYQSQEAHNEMVEGLLLEARLRTRIAELRDYRRNGVRTFADAEVYDTEKRRQKAAADAAQAAANAVHGNPYSSYGTKGPGAASAAKGGKAAAAAATQTPAGQAPAQAVAAEDGAAPSGLGAASSMDLSRPAASVPMGRGAAAALQAWRTKRGVPLDISCLPGVELLSGKERELCATSRLLPNQYLALKDMLMRDCDKHGHITRQEARTFFRLEPQRALRIYDLLVASGWISSGGRQSGGAGGAGLTDSAAGQPMDGDDMVVAEDENNDEQGAMTADGGS